MSVVEIQITLAVVTKQRLVLGVQSSNNIADVKILP